MRDLPQEFHRVLFGLQGIFLRIAVTEDPEFFHLQFYRLALGRRGHENSFDRNASAGRNALQQCFRSTGEINDRLDILNCRSIVDGYELIVPESSYPALDCNRLVFGFRDQQVLYLGAFHWNELNGRYVHPFRPRFAKNEKTWGFS